MGRLAAVLHDHQGENLRKIAAVSAFFAASVMAAAPASARDGDAGNGAQKVADAVSGLLPDATAETCQNPLVENPFVFAGDALDYVLAPDGSFEALDGGGWLLDGGAGAVDGNDPFPIHASGEDDTILSLPAGSSAVSAPMCVDLDYPHFRLAVHQIARADGKVRGKLRVDTLYPGAKNPRWHKVDVIRLGDDAWVLSDFLDLEPERGGSAPGGRQVSLRFSVIGDDGAFEIDDVYVDPRFRI